MRVGGVYAVNLFLLSGAQSLVRIQTPDALEQSLPPENLVKPGDAALEAVGGVEEGGVAVRYFDAADEHLARHLALLAVVLALDEQSGGLLRPNRPVAQQAADDAALGETVAAQVKVVGGEQVQGDVVVVARVQGDVVAAGLGDRADDVERLIPIERRHL